MKIRKLTCIGFPKYGITKSGTPYSKKSGRWKKLKQQTLPKGYKFVQLRKDGRSHQKYTHHLVLYAFVGPCPPGMEACHFPDKNPAKNNLSNLRWGTKQENAKHKETHGTVNRWERNGGCKLTKREVILMLKLRNKNKRKYSYSKLAKIFPLVHVGTIGKILRREKWKGVI